MAAAAIQSVTGSGPDVCVRPGPPNRSLRLALPIKQASAVHILFVIDLEIVQQGHCPAKGNAKEKRHCDRRHKGIKEGKVEQKRKKLAINVNAHAMSCLVLIP